MDNWKPSENDPSATDNDSRPDSSLSRESAHLSEPSKGTTPAVESHERTQAKMPLTPGESLQQQYQNRSTANTTASTSTTSASEKSCQSMLTTPSARFIELEAHIP